MIRITKTAAVRAARRSAVPALVALAFAAAGTPAYADVAGLDIGPVGHLTASGDLVVSGSYVCDPADSAFAELGVYATGVDAYGNQVDASVLARVACTGGPERWRARLTPTLAYQTFADGWAQISVNAWTGDDWDGRISAAAVVSVP